jgi:hypothetical protein
VIISQTTMNVGYGDTVNSPLLCDESLSDPSLGLVADEHRLLSILITVALRLQHGARSRTFVFDSVIVAELHLTVTRSN